MSDKYCKDQEGRNRAARSLILLGVPAKSAIMQCALNGRGEEQEYCTSALGYFGGKDVVKALCQVMLDPNAAHECPKYAAIRLARICDPESGPALETIVEKCAYIEAATQAAAALERIGRVEAAPKIFERMISAYRAAMCNGMKF